MTRPDGRPGWYSWLAMLLSSLTMGALAIIVSISLAGKALDKAEQARRDADAKWCSLLVTLDDSYSDPAHVPSSLLGKAIAKAIGDLRKAYACPPNE